MKLCLLAGTAFLALTLRAADTNALVLVETIPLPGVHGRIDHLAMDVSSRRLFVAALGNDTVEVVDLAAGRRVRSIGGCSEPQGLAFLPAENRLVIANGGSGVVKILDGTSFKTLASVGHLPDADNVRFDAAAGLIYTGYGGGALAVIRADNGEPVASIQLPGHPESFQLEKNGRRIFVNVPDAGQIAVIDREQRKVVATWLLGDFRANFPMALDETGHRLFVGCRRLARLLVLDTANGRQIADVEISRDADDVFYDAARKRIYVSCGGGFIDVIDQRGADEYSPRERIATSGGARTGYFSPARNELFLAARAGMFSGDAEIRIFQARP